MSTLTDLAHEALDIAEACGNDINAMTEAELATMATNLKVSALASASFLAHRCGDDGEAARAHISRALDLPPPVLRRRAKEAADIINGGDLPDCAQHAAHIAVMMHEVRVISLFLERKQTGAALN